MEFRVYANGVNHWMDDSRRPAKFMNMTMDMPGVTRTAGGYASAVIAPARRHTLTLRVEAVYSTHYAEMVMHPDESRPMKMVTWPAVHRWNAGLFTEYRLLLNQAVLLKIGLRNDVYRSRVTDSMGANELRIYYPDQPLERSDHLLAANGSLSWQLHPVWKTVVALAVGSRIPTVTETYGYFLYNALDGYLYTGNPRLRPEKSRQVEWRNRFTFHRADWQVTVYRYRFVDYIFGIPHPDGVAVPYANGWRFYANVGTAILRGVELSCRYEPGRRWSIFGGMEYEQGRLVGLEDSLPLIPPFQIHGAVRYSYAAGWIQLEGKGCFRQSDYSRLGGENATPGYRVLAVRGRQMLTGALTLEWGVDNVTNTAYHDHLDWGDVPRPGRNLYFRLTLEQ
jgi:iron complex outermembrane receptor protein